MHPGHSSTGRRLQLPPQEQFEALQRPGPGMPVRRASSAISAARGSKARSPRASGPLGCGAPGIGAWRKPTCSTSRSPPPSISTALSRGSTSAHGRRRAPPVSPLSRLLHAAIQARQPPEVLLRSSRPLRRATRAELHRFYLFYTTKIIIVANWQKKASCRRLSRHTLLL